MTCFNDNALLMLSSMYFAVLLYTKAPIEKCLKNGKVYQKKCRRSQLFYDADYPVFANQFKKE